MSEYQCYEFVALERPLTAKQMAELRSVSTRAEITPTRFWNEYHRGDFKGDAAKLVARYFDAHLYVANWGTRRLMLRLPSKLVSSKSLRPYFVGGAARASSAGTQVVIDICSNEEVSDDFEESEDGRLAALAPLRSELIGGDFRAAYLAWRLALQAGDVDINATEPPLPAGLTSLTAAQHTMVEFFRLDHDLLSAAEAESPALPDNPMAARRWLRSLPIQAKNDWLERALSAPNLGLGTELLGAFRQQAKTLPSRTPRSVADLLALAEASRAKRVRLQEHRQPRSPTLAAPAARARKQ